MVPWLSYSPLDLRFAESNPAGVNGFFQNVKILPSDGKYSRGSRVLDLRNVKESQAEIRATEQNFSDFSRSL